MARVSKPKEPPEVIAYDHDEKRTNIPTADAAVDFFDEDAAKLPPVEYERVITDPELVWRGKTDAPLVVDAPPIYIQEKIDPRALIANLRAHSKPATTDEAPSLFDFEEFDTLDELSQVEFYQHEESWKNRMILGDSLQVMGSLAEREALRGKVQMIYVDPPYGIKFGSNWQARTNKRDVRDGKLDDAAREAEQIKAFRDTWGDGINTYLSYLRDRLVTSFDLLADSGSVFVQIGDENVHLVRSLLDEVFGRDNLVSEIAVTKTTSATSEYLANITDYILWYAKDTTRLKFRSMWIPAADDRTGYRWLRLADGTRRSATAGELADETLIPAGASVYKPDNLTSSRPPGSYPVEFEGKTYYRPTSFWKTHEQGMQRLIVAGRIHSAANSIQYIRMKDDFPYRTVTNVWTDMGTGNFTEDKIYVVQTAAKMVQRCMLMCTDPGDLVLDPTCGSGTTAFVAEQWGRRWITIDTSRVALALARKRIMGAKYPYYSLADSEEGRKADGLPPATTTEDLRHGFVYKKVQHITLKSIANNPDIKEGMSREEIDAAIKKHADFELLYDQPFEDKSKVRVAGPFTVESLSPHRNVSFDEAESLHGSEDEAVAGFEEMILANLRRAGIQNGRRAERIEFESLEQYPGTYVQAIGDRKNGTEPTSRVAIALGPQYGTVSPGFIKQAAKEAILDDSVDLLCVLGFAFDPQATGVTEEDGVTVVEEFASVEGERKLGRIQVLLVRMNADLLMGEDLKKTGSGNLFTVFGEPDLEVHHVDEGKFVAEIRGVDIYDPTTGEVRASTTDQIALWMIDTDYNGESFFVRHAYFTGDNDPFKQLKTALKADIDPDAWAALYRTVSLPFNPPSTGKIAVKVINDYGDEVMKVLEVG
ncbi:site-specific DNA-methyltransferase [Protaetiibacter larvae]|uniref:Site-specific DNA-methyltransferase n=1 Tax=Protaetiibacter larvae TaxID=2592654 RepID=A0A5C1Y976_9MICO|nr:site-specific DNA-methyltransferase [Protaetiibacter larvae]QEO09928.1 site-specific DNA-methyltransferase [Protaetiibacter larvae]